MRKILFMMLLLLLWSTASMNGQVLIGDQIMPNDNPHDGAVLELRSGGKEGLLLPRVILTAVGDWLPVDGVPTEGMMVLNTSTSNANGLEGKGLYVWSGNSWNKMGNASKPCTEIFTAVTTPINFSGQGSNQTLGVEVIAGSPPYNFVWKKGGVILDEILHTSNPQSSFQTSDYGTYVCEVINSCTNYYQTATFVVSDVNPSDYTQNNTATTNSIAWSLSGTGRFDVRSSLVPSSQYDLAVSNATVVDVVWNFEDSKAVLAGATGNTSSATLFFKDHATVTAASPATVVVSAYITMQQGSTPYKVTETKNVIFQNTALCDGAVIKNGAYDYVSGSLPGDGAKVGGAANNSNAPWSPNLDFSIGAYDATILNPYFKATNIDLCVYKANGNSGGYSTWSVAVNNCANGSYADGDADGGWYLPNERELQAIYNALGGSGQLQPAIKFANIQTPSYVATTAADMPYYSWSSTENNNTEYAFTFYCNGGQRNNVKKSQNNYIRCVKRL